MTSDRETRASPREESQAPTQQELPDAWVASWGYDYEQASEREAFWSENLAESKVSEWKNSHDNPDNRWYVADRYQLTPVIDG